jgi:hypothetical protein
MSRCHLRFEFGEALGKLAGDTFRGNAPAVESIGP